MSATYSGGVQLVYDVTGDAQAKLQALSQALVDELAKLSVRQRSLRRARTEFAGADAHFSLPSVRPQKDGSSLPAAARDNLAKAYKDLLAVITAKDKPALDKGKEVVVYVQVRAPFCCRPQPRSRSLSFADPSPSFDFCPPQETLQPILDGALRILHTTKEKAEEGADVAADKAGSAADKAKSKTAKGANMAEDKTQKGLDYAKDKAAQGKDAVNGQVQQ